MSRDVKYIGMDVHKEAIVIAVRNTRGNVVMESIVETKASSILQCIHGLRADFMSPGKGRLFCRRLAFEAAVSAVHSEALPWTLGFLSSWLLYSKWSQGF